MSHYFFTLMLLHFLLLYRVLISVMAQKRPLQNVKLAFQHTIDVPKVHTLS